jgi:wyosine [tRNA(Phe)-imidazoG37] synthetase (radical SAM superfamily)
MKMEAEPRNFYDPADIRDRVAEKVDRSARAGEPIDYLTFVPDGEPTLDLRLGQAVDWMRPQGIKIAVITNSSLIWHGRVHEHLQKIFLALRRCIPCGKKPSTNS